MEFGHRRVFDKSAAMDLDGEALKDLRPSALEDQLSAVGAQYSGQAFAGVAGRAGEQDAAAACFMAIVLLGGESVRQRAQGGSRTRSVAGCALRTRR